MNKNLFTAVTIFFIGISSATVHSNDCERMGGVIIDANTSNWSIVNNPKINTFCIPPGDYTRFGEIYINSSGTREIPRSILAVDESGNRVLAPYLIGSAKVIVSKIFGTGSHWQISGLIVKQKDGVRTLIRGDDINYRAMLFEGGGSGGGMVQLVGQDQKLMDSVLRETSIAPGQDRHCVAVSQGAAFTKIANNEIYNCAGDGIQVHHGSGEGLTITGNQIYFTPDFVNAENAIDIKGAGTENDPILIEGNTLWGLNKGGATSSSGGLIDFSSKDEIKGNVHIRENFIFDSDRWLISTAMGTGNGYVKNLLIRNNYFWNSKETMLFLTSNGTPNHNIVVEDNVILIENLKNAWIYIDSNGLNRNNNIIRKWRVERVVKNGLPETLSKKVPGKDIAGDQLKRACFFTKRLTAQDLHCIYY